MTNNRIVKALYVDWLTGEAYAIIETPGPNNNIIEGTYKVVEDYEPVEPPKLLSEPVIDDQQNAS